MYSFLVVVKVIIAFFSCTGIDFKRITKFNQYLLYLSSRVCVFKILTHDFSQVLVM